MRACLHNVVNRVLLCMKCKILRFKGEKNMKIKFLKRSICSFLVLLLTAFTLGFANVETANAATTHNPVVFVHGLGGSSTNFYFIKNYMRSQGWSSDELFAVELPDKILDAGNNYINSRTLDEYVNRVLEKTGKSKVDIVAHSMGGANSLYYISRLDGADKVDRLVTIGGANKLSVSRAPEGVDVTSIYTINDQIVMNSLSILPGADNKRIYGVGHIGLLNNRQVNKLIVQALQ